MKYLHAASKNKFTSRKQILLLFLLTKYQITLFSSMKVHLILFFFKVGLWLNYIFLDELTEMQSLLNNHELIIKKPSRLRAMNFENEQNFKMYN